MRGSSIARTAASVTKLDLKTDVYALLDALDEVPVPPLPAPVKAMILDQIHFANCLDLAGEAAPRSTVVQTQSRELFCSNVITNRGVVAFSGILRVIAFLHGRGVTPCILDVFPLKYMSWHTMAQRKAVTNDMLGKLRDALSALVGEQGVKWVYDAICANLFIPNAVKAALYSEILADMVHAGLVDAVADLLQHSEVDPSRNNGRLLQAAMDGQHPTILTLLRLDERIDTCALDQQEEEEACRLADYDVETHSVEASGSDDEEETRGLAVPAEAEVGQATTREESAVTDVAREDGAQQIAVQVERQEQDLSIVAGEDDVCERARVEKQGQDVDEEHVLELAEKMLDGTSAPDLPALQRLSTLASRRDDLITLSAAKVFHGRHVGEPDWIIPMTDPTSSMGEVLRVRISTTALLVPSGSWELSVRLRSPSYMLPKINVEVNIQAPVIGPENQLGWESRTLCVDDIQLPATDGQYVQWRVPIEPIHVESALGFNKLVLRLMKMPNVYLFDDLLLDTVEVRSLRSVWSAAPIGGSLSALDDLPPILSKLGKIAASASMSNTPVFVAPALIAGAQSRFVDPLHPDDRTIRDPRWDDLSATDAPTRPHVEVGQPTRPWRPAPGSHIVMDDVDRAHQQLNVRALANVGRIIRGPAGEHDEEFPPPPYEPRDSAREGAVPDLERSNSEMEEDVPDMEEDVPDMEEAAPCLE
ncbi:hypothetical protein AMAG_14058 [Allomyces macrogynus ATCC 38327]|uniref:Uncharacterized protein n=1 Tax=Allomyces macrogynus (strain ATCC 38327) TaxID=578462 RepID=A0A0L0T437_ALLM3|nr:hypothetical protein AMAG_14058 [Allomyces macrogynus ATCC 38327]|eukprot:KNE69492.1 hypothetical protein AMAG_14058 [Allomyces macrogynus ATCC 38327]